MLKLGHNEVVSRQKWLHKILIKDIMYIFFFYLPIYDEGTSFTFVYCMLDCWLIG